MARQYFSATVNASLGQGAYSLASGRGGLPTVDTAAISTDNTATDAAITAMGALTGYSALTGASAALAAAHAAVATVTADIAALAPAVAGEVLLSYDGAEITSFNQLKRAVERLLQDAFASGTLTP